MDKTHRSRDAVAVMDAAPEVGDVIIKDSPDRQFAFTVIGRECHWSRRQDKHTAVLFMVGRCAICRETVVFQMGANEIERGTKFRRTCWKHRWMYHPPKQTRRTRGKGGAA